jgi:hypothetical protein
MSCFILNRETWVDLLEWLTHGKLPMRTWGNSAPGAYLLDRLKYADADILPPGTIGYHAVAAAESITLQQRKGRKAGMDEAKAAALAVCHILYMANCRAFDGRYANKHDERENADGWEDILAGLGQVVPFQVLKWDAKNALGILACWHYQCSEDVADEYKYMHTALMVGVDRFRLEIAEAIIGHSENGWIHRMTG